ncbi:MAG: type II toxin-antitoxin system PemK/MazF family toxin [Sphingobium sp.]
MTFDRFDVHVVPFPFSDRDKSKRRPALVICDETFVARTGNVLLAMITSAKHSAWPYDCQISEIENVGFSSASIVRMRISTLATEQVGRKIGRLCSADISAVRAALKEAILS